jgi:fluoride ion exporter CrcB/FEX
MKKYFKWLTESNRPKHIVVGFFIGLTLGVVAAFVAAASAEMKDWLWNGKRGGTFGWIKGNGFDWLDFIATMIGGIAGALFRYLVLWHVHLMK